jgi:hypothetical protein
MCTSSYNISICACCFTVCDYVFNITLRINIDYFCNQYQQFVFEM